MAIFKNEDMCTCGKSVDKNGKCTCNNEKCCKEGIEIPPGCYTGIKIKELTEACSANNLFCSRLDAHAEEIINLLKEKNKAYGNSALNPANVFSKLNAVEALCSRIDDKLMRIQNKGINDKTEDTLDDLIGYLFLLRMALSDKRED